jgi:uncharacterized membrane protein YgcG
MTPLLIVVVVGVIVLVVAVRSRRREAARNAEVLAAVRSVAEEDVTRLGEDVVHLDFATAGRDLDEATQQDYRRALDSYDAAKSALGRVARPEDVRGVTGILEDGRYAVACVQARLEGRPVPARRPPCFFNPQHGPSVEDVEWAPPGGAPRPVPTCAADAERVRAGAEPDVRKVPVGAGRRPYWQAGPAYGPWAQGYFSPFAGSGLLPGVLLGAALTGGFGGWDNNGYDSGYDAGYDAGTGNDDSGANDSGADGGADNSGYDDGGSYDGGGYDGGGGFDGGGFDGGGFDGGGGDFGGGGGSGF